MLTRKSAFFPVAALAFLFFFPTPLAAQRFPSPSTFRREMQLRALTAPRETSPTKFELGPAPQLVGSGTQWAGRDRLGVLVYQRGKPVKLAPRFRDLVAVTPTAQQAELDKLRGKWIALVPSEKHAEQWDVFLGVGGVNELTLADNIFKVRQVLVSSEKSPLEVHIDAQIHRLKPGEALLVL